MTQHASIADRLKDDNVRLVSFLFCDNAGVIRGKSVHVDCLDEKIHSGASLCRAVQAATNVDELTWIAGMGAAGEVRLIPDLDTLTPLPYAPGWAAVIADLATVDGEPWSVCPRAFLKRMVQRAAGMGLFVRAAFEPEWYLARREQDRYVPLDESLDNSTVGTMYARRVIDDVVRYLDGQGIPVEQYYAELGPGQQEVTMGSADALTAADRLVLYRETVRNAAFHHGLLASFAPKPFPDQAGSGSHIHFSVWDRPGDHNLFYAPDDPLHMSPLAYSFIAGVVERLPALVALTCPSMNSYRRLEAGWWSSPYACYGLDNREAGLRVPSLFRGKEMESANIELRASDGSANPYLALGAFIAAGLDGVRRGLTPQPGQCVDLDPALYTDEELNLRSIRPLPSTLREAIAELESDRVLSDALGPDLAESFLTVRKAEWEHFIQRDADYEIQQHFHKY